MIDKEIQSRMDAFRGNPQALMQRYAQNQQLIDLLALQKLKSEKEAAMRQMQMQAGQGQMPTVAQQREQELMGMAKQEVADRVGQVAQQQAKQQQENLQRAAQTGIAQAPAPNMMPTQAMASGGIVAFAGGGDTGVKTIEHLQKEYEDARAAGDFQEASRLFRVIKARKELAPRTVTVPVAEMGGAPTAAQPVGAFQGEPQQITAQIAAIQDPNERAAAMAAFQRQQAAGPIPPGPQAQGIAQAAPRATMEQKLPGEPAEIGGGKYVPSEDQSKRVPMQTQDESLRAAYAQTGIGALTAKPEAAGMSAEEAYAKRFDPLFQQQLALKQQGLAEAQRLAERERAMRDPLMAWMAGARGRTIGEVLGNAGRAGMEYQQQGLTRDQVLAKQLQDLQEAQLGAQITQEKEKYGVGEARRKEAADEREKAFTGVGPYLSRLEMADVQRQNAELRAEQAKARALQAQSLTPVQIAKLRDSAIDNVRARMEKDVQLKLDIANNKVSRKALEDDEFVRLISEAAPELAAQFRTSQPAALSNIPAPPPGAVRPKGAK